MTRLGARNKFTSSITPVPAADRAALSLQFLALPLQSTPEKAPSPGSRKETGQHKEELIALTHTQTIARRESNEKKKRKDLARRRCAAEASNKWEAAAAAAPRCAAGRPPSRAGTPVTRNLASPHQQHQKNRQRQQLAVSSRAERSRARSETRARMRGEMT